MLGCQSELLMLLSYKRINRIPKTGTNGAGLEIIGNRAFVAACLTTLLMSAIFFAALLYLPQFMTKQFQVGLVGYFYQQLTPDSGCAPIICPFESRVIGVGPQIGYLFPVGDMQGYLNLKGYGEFDNNARPDGFNVWLTLSLSPKAPAATASKSPMLTK